MAETGMQAAHAELEAFFSKRPQSLPAMRKLAIQRHRLRDYAGAEHSARSALQLDPGDMTTSAASVMTLAALERCGEARPLVRPTLEAHEILFEDFDFMLAAAYCYLATDDVVTAEQVLLALQAKVPEAQREPKFQRMANILQAKAGKAPQ